MFSSLLSQIKSGDKKPQNSDVNNVRATNTGSSITARGNTAIRNKTQANVNINGRSQQLSQTSKSNIRSQLAREKYATTPSTTHIDPAVARLKAARQAEKEAELRKKEEQKRQRQISRGIDPDAKKKSTTASKNSSHSSSSSNSGATSKKPRQSHPRAGSRGTRTQLESQESTPFGETKKKLKFNELMKEAAKVDGKNITININSRNNSKTPDPEPTKSKTAASRQMKKPSPATSLSSIKNRTSSGAGVPSGSSSFGRNARQSLPGKPLRAESRNGKFDITRRHIPEPAPKLKPAAPLRLAGPSERLKKKLEQKRKLQETQKKRSNRGYNDYDDEDDYDDDFIVDDEEEEDYGRGERDPGYDRDEIWAMFNKGKRRTYYDDDDDESDMEATGVDVLEEEEASARLAALEEKREKELERRLLREKQERLKRQRR